MSIFAPMQTLKIALRHRLSQVTTYWYTCSEETLKQRPAPGKWSKKEILGHLIDSAQNNIRRLVVGQYEPGAHIVYNQDVWVQAADYQDYKSGDLIQLWVLLNQHFIRVMENLPESAYPVLTNWGKDEPEYVTLQYVAEDYLRHLDHHLAQLYR